MARFFALERVAPKRLLHGYAERMADGNRGSSTHAWTLPRGRRRRGPGEDMYMFRNHFRQYIPVPDFDLFRIWCDNLVYRNSFAIEDQIFVLQEALPLTVHTLVPSDMSVGSTNPVYMQYYGELLWHLITAEIQLAFRHRRRSPPPWVCRFVRDMSHGLLEKLLQRSCARFRSQNASIKICSASHAPL